MHIVGSASSFIGTGLVAGILGGMAMELVLWLMTRAGWAKVDMITALGSLFTRKVDGAWTLGILLHIISAIAFALAYTLVLAEIGFTHLPGSLMLGLGIGILHGLIVSLALVWVVAEQHPLPQFREAGLAVGLTHLVAHAAYGAVVGLVIGFAHLS